MKNILQTLSDMLPLTTIPIKLKPQFDFLSDGFSISTPDYILFEWRIENYQPLKNITTSGISFLATSLGLIALPIVQAQSSSAPAPFHYTNATTLAVSNYAMVPWHGNLTEVAHSILANLTSMPMITAGSKNIPGVLCSLKNISAAEFSLFKECNKNNTDADEFVLNSINLFLQGQNESGMISNSSLIILLSMLGGSLTLLFLSGLIMTGIHYIPICHKSPNNNVPPARGVENPVNTNLPNNGNDGQEIVVRNEEIIDVQLAARRVSFSPTLFVRSLPQSKESNEAVTITLTNSSN